MFTTPATQTFGWTYAIEGDDWNIVAKSSVVRSGRSACKISQWVNYINATVDTVYL